MKKHLTGILLAIMLCCIGCSQSEGKEEILVDAQPKESEKEEITLMHVDAGKREFEQFIEAAEQLLDLKINIVAPPDNAENRQAKISTMLSSGDASVDVFSVNDEMISEFKYLGYLEPLGTDVMTAEIRDHYPQDYMEKIAMVNGEVYSVPYLLDILIFWVNEEYLRKAGLTEITTAEEFKQFLAADFGTGCYGYGGAWDETYVYNDLFHFINLFGGDYYDWNDEHTRAALKFLHDMLAADQTPQSQLIDQYEQMEHKFIEGKYGTVFMYSGAMDVFLRSGKYGSDQLHAAPIPAFREDVTNIATWQYVLNKASAKKDAAKRFLRYAASKEGSMSYATYMNRLPARMDVILDEDLSIIGGAEIKAYVEDGIQLKARPLSANAMEDIEAIGSLFQQYMTNQITLDRMCEEANEIVNASY